MMIDPHLKLGVEPNASYEQINEAYNKKHAELLSQEPSDPSVREQIDLLDEALTQMLGKANLAIISPAAPQPPADPALIIIDTLDAPIQVTSGNISYQSCPYCGTQNPTQSSVCNSCGKQISRPCPNCGKQILLGIMICPRCNTVVREHDQQRLAEAVITRQKVEDQRLEDSVRIETLETAHRKRAQMGVVFWIAMILIAIGICYMGYYALNYFGAQ